MSDGRAVLRAIVAACAARERALRLADEHLAHRDELIRVALRSDLPRADIAAAAGIKDKRMYQIRREGSGAR